MLQTRVDAETDLNKSNKTLDFYFSRLYNNTIQKQGG